MNKVLVLLHKNKADYTSFVDRIKENSKKLILDIGNDFKFNCSLFKAKNLLAMYCFNTDDVPDTYLYQERDDPKSDDIVAEPKLGLITKIIKKILTLDELEGINTVIFAVHWGGLPESVYQERTIELNKFLEDNKEKSFRFSWYSEAKHLHLSIDHLVEEFESQIRGEITNKKKVYELMENLLIHAFPEFYENKTPVEISDPQIYTDTVWLMEELKEKLNSSRMIKNGNKKERLEQICKNDGKLEKVLKYDKANRKVKIENLLEFRTVMRELLSILPGDIYLKTR